MQSVFVAYRNLALRSSAVSGSLFVELSLVILQFLAWRAGVTTYPTLRCWCSGNYFSADCSYVRNLIPPAHFKKEMMSVDVNRKLMSAEFGTFQHNLHPEADSTSGLGSYALEHWIGSSPDVIPCDLVGKENWPSERENVVDPTFDWSFQPRSPPGFLSGELHYDKALRLREYSLLGGLLFKWQALYKKVPPPESWAWKWFPDGLAWAEDRFGLWCVGHGKTAQHYDELQANDVPSPSSWRT